MPERSALNNNEEWQPSLKGGEWNSLSEEGEWLVQGKKRQARKEQLIRAQSFVYPEIY